MKALRELELFTRIAELGSLSEAARSLDITPAAASAALKRLESEVDTILVVRSTRALRLTPQGEVFLEYCQRALQLMIQGRDAAQGNDRRVTGLLQISVSSDFGRNVLLPWLNEFQTEHSGVQIRLTLSDHVADIIKDNVDVAIRYGIPPDSSLIAIPLAATNRRVLVASPDYIAQNGQPTTPYDLANHNCARFMLGDQRHSQWRFIKNNNAISVKVSGNSSANDGDVVRKWALSGAAIAYKSELDAKADIEAGRLVHLCPDWLGEPAPLYLIVADRRQLSPQVKLLKEFLLERCEWLLKNGLPQNH